MKHILLTILITALSSFAAEPPKLLPPDWNAKAAGDRVMEGLVNISAPHIKGAHDAGVVIANDKAYVVAIANDVQPGENPEWFYCYASLSVVNVKTRAVEKTATVARSGQVFENETLPPGSCFVPRIIQKDPRTLRCFFASEAPKERQAQMWFTDFDIERGAFENRIHRAKLKTAGGVFDMQPKPFYDDAVANGFKREAKLYGLYLIDAFKVFDGKTYAVLNNYAVGLNALALLNPEMDMFEVLGHFNEPQNLKLTESAVNRLPDGTWLAILRQEGGNRNYVFSTSLDGRHWTPGEFRKVVPNGTSSKPTFNRFKDVYYLGWQESTRIAGVGRSVFNIEVSTDCVHWERKYRFESAQTFQYPTLSEYQGTIYLTVTQGQKERIMFGKLE
jgi:hypothetical protein